MRLILTYVFIGVVCSVVVGGQEVSTDRLDERTRCIALFAEVLAYAKCRNPQAFFAKIADGGGADTFWLVPPEEVAELFKLGGVYGDTEKFFEKTVPHAAKILEHFDTIRFAGLRREKEVRVGSRGRRGGAVGRGELLAIEITLPEAVGADLAKTGMDGNKIYSRLIFVEVDDQLYWVPFGW